MGTSGESNNTHMQFIRSHNTKNTSLLPEPWRCDIRGEWHVTMDTDAADYSLRCLRPRVDHTVWEIVGDPSCEQLTMKCTMAGGSCWKAFHSLFNRIALTKVAENELRVRVSKFGVPEGSYTLTCAP